MNNLTVMVRIKWDNACIWDSAGYVIRTLEMLTSNTSTLK